MSHPVRPAFSSRDERDPGKETRGSKKLRRTGDFPAASGDRPAGAAPHREEGEFWSFRRSNVS
jgi:hypothetical protein